jgi:hypothetical protein
MDQDQLIASQADIWIWIGLLLLVGLIVVVGLLIRYRLQQIAAAQQSLPPRD